MKAVYGIVVAAGSGTRMGAVASKTLLPLCGRPAIWYSIKKLRPYVKALYVVIRAHERADFETALAGQDVRFVIGGETRRQSVAHALDALPPDATHVLVHDGARPLVSESTIENVLAGLDRAACVFPALTVVDTLKKREGERGLGADLRDAVRTVQTPQGFSLSSLKEAYAAPEDGAEDGEAMERIGHAPLLVPGNRDNIKLTTKEDVAMAEKLMQPVCLPRVGLGYDVHRLTAGRRLILCGVDVPHDLGLLGHSDADVALHALSDALLGACALGDIGQHFPDTDAAYKDADSMVLLRGVADRVRAAGYIPYNVDVVIACQKPKLAPYMEAMRRNVAGALGLDIGFVSVKATTTEKLGFEGRQEGISATATASVIPRP